MSGITLDDYVTQSTSTDGPSTPPEVSWQTCFWILIKLGLNTVAQPDGRFRTSFSACVQQLIDDRFESDGSIDGMKSLRSTAQIRWLFFILGPLPQALRLATFNVVPFTQICRLGFISSWFLMEIIVFVSWWKKGRHLRQPCANGSNKKLLKIGTMDRMMVYLALFGHIASTITTPITSAILPLQDKLEGFPYWLVYSRNFLSVSCLICLFIGVINLCFLFLRPICERNLALSENLLVAFPEGDVKSLKVDGVTLLLFLCFIVSFWSCLGTYCHFYRSSGTVNLGWTAIFG